MPHHSFVVFYSKHFDKAISSADLVNIKEEQLEILLAEAAKVSSECLAKYEWSKTTSPKEWPDEDWPRRVCKKGTLVASFVKSVNTQIKKRRHQRHVEAALKRARAINKRREESATNLVQQENGRIIRIRYIKAAIRELFGDKAVLQVLQRSREIAEENGRSGLTE